MTYTTTKHCQAAFIFLFTAKIIKLPSKKAKV